MTSATVLRWSGLAMMSSSVLWLIGLLGVTGRMPLIGSSGGSLLYGIAGLLVLVGLIGLQRRSPGRFDRRGKAGFIVAYCGATLVGLGGIAEGLSNTKALQAVFLLGSLILFFGAFAIGRSALRARLLPRWHILPLVISSLSFVVFVVVAIAVFTILQLSEPTSGALINLVPFVLIAAFGAGWLALGYGLWNETTDLPVRTVASGGQVAS